MEVDEIIDAGDRILVAGRMSGRGKTSGVEVGVDEYHVWTVHDGRPVRMQMYHDRDEALRAAGMQGREVRAP
jgi:ketosteroid isomerase-like protein